MKKIVFIQNTMKTHSCLKMGTAYNIMMATYQIENKNTYYAFSRIDILAKSLNSLSG